MKRFLIFMLMILLSLDAKDDETLSFFIPAPYDQSTYSKQAKSAFLEKFNHLLEIVSKFCSLEYALDQPIWEIKQSFSELQDFENDYGFFSLDHPLIGQTSILKDDDRIIIDQMNWVQKEVGDTKLKQFYITELLAKGLAYRNLAPGDELLIPDAFTDNKKIKYKVEKVFNLGLGLPAFGLVPESLEYHPILLFRGTDLHFSQKGSFASVISDLDIFGPGYTSFFFAKDEIEEFLNEFASFEKKTIVMGYSLGGILTLYVQNFFNHLIDQKNSIAFNPPGLPKKMAKEFIKDQKRNQIRVIVNQNDPVSKWGFLVGQVEVITLEKAISPLEAHTRLMSAQEGLRVYGCDLSKENQRHCYLFNPE